MKTNLAPIILFVYNRLEHTQKTIEALSSNTLAKESELFIYSDDAKDISNSKKVNDVREYIKSIDCFKKVTIIEKEKNFGLAKSIIDGVTNIINVYGKAIVLEDDLVTSPYFLKFMNDALELYKNEKKVWEIGGYVYPININKDTNSFFMPYTTSWGWATWSDRWEHFERDPQSLVEKFSKNDIKKFNLDNSDNLWIQVIRNNDKKLYTWAIFWYAIVFLNKGLTLYPYRSIVKNIGHDGSGENCRNTNEYNTTLLEEEITLIKKEIKIDENIFKKVKKYFKNKKKSFFSRCLNKLFKVFK